jgi:hypothetical protein
MSGLPDDEIALLKEHFELFDLHSEGESKDAKGAKALYNWHVYFGSFRVCFVCDNF